MNPYMLPPGQTDDSQGVLRYDAGAYRTRIPNEPQNTDWQAYLAWKAQGNTPAPAAPPPVIYSQSQPVEARLTTSDAAVTEIFRFACASKHLYQGSLTVSGIDRANGVSKLMEGRFVWKRPGATAVMVGITTVSDIRDAAAASWLPNATASGTDIVFTVTGASGRTIDWLLKGQVDSFAPEGT